MTVAGGVSGDGVAFSITLKGATTVLHDFIGGYDGAQPNGLVTNADTSAVYGATYRGGSP